MGKGMRAGKKSKPKMPGGGGGSMQQQIAQAQAMQRQLAMIQSELEEKEFTATAGGGAVSVTANGKKELTALNFDKDVVDPDDVEMLEDLIMTCINDVMSKIDSASNAEFGKYNIPGLGL